MQGALSQEALRQVVVEQQAEAARLRSLPFIERDKLSELSDVIDKPWIKVVKGIRRSGKSILCHQALKNKSYGYLNFDDERLIGLSAPHLNQMLQFLLETNPHMTVLFFDEIQNVEGWELFANRLQRQGYNLVITGSNSKLLSKELATHLTGRHISIELSPFSFREFLRAKQFIWTDLRKTEERATVIHFLNEYLQSGGFPEMVSLGYNAEYLRELYDKIISRDITYRYHIKYSTTLKEIALYSHANLSHRITFHKVKNIFDINSIHTVKNYYQYLGDAYLVFLVQMFSYKHKEKVKQPRKLYTIDNGLSAAINPKFTQDLGAGLENLVFQECLRRQYDFGYYATQEYEVDFVIHEQRQISHLIQVAYSLENAETKKREIKALLKMAEQTGCPHLTILTWDERGEEILEGKKISIVPAWQWMLNVL